MARRRYAGARGRHRPLSIRGRSTTRAGGRGRAKSRLRKRCRVTLAAAHQVGGGGDPGREPCASRPTPCSRRVGPRSTAAMQPKQRAPRSPNSIGWRPAAARVRATDRRATGGSDRVLSRACELQGRAYFIVVDAIDPSGQSGASCRSATTRRTRPRRCLVLPCEFRTRPLSPSVTTRRETASCRTRASARSGAVFSSLNSDAGARRTHHSLVGTTGNDVHGSRRAGSRLSRRSAERATKKPPRRGAPLGDGGGGTAAAGRGERFSHVARCNLDR